MNTTRRSKISDDNEDWIAELETQHEETKRELLIEHEKLVYLQNTLSEMSLIKRELESRRKEEQEKFNLEKEQLIEEQDALRILNARLTQRLRNAFLERDEIKREYSLLLTTVNEKEKASEDNNNNNTQTETVSFDREHLRQELNKLASLYQEEISDRESKIQSLENDLQERDSRISGLQESIETLSLNQNHSNQISTTNNNFNTNEKEEQELELELELELEEEKSISDREYVNLVNLLKQRDSLKQFIQDNEEQTERGQGAYEKVRKERNRYARLLYESEEENIRLETRVAELEKALRAKEQC